MMGGGYFDNMWYPNSRADAYRGTQPRPRYYRPQASVYDPYGSSRVPESQFPRKVEEPSSRKTVKAIPVTDGNAPVAMSQKVSYAEVVPGIAKFKSEDDAAVKLQAVYRGYSVRKTQPLKHLRVIKKVKEDLANFMHKLQETEQKEKLRGESQERLRWTEGIMALLLRLDSLQGVHPDVRLIRKALTKELIAFQEKVDTMHVVSGELNEKDDDIIEGNIDNSEEVKEGGKVCNVDAHIPAAEDVQEMQVEESIPERSSGVKTVGLEEIFYEADGTSIAPENKQVMEQEFASGGASEECENANNNIDVTKNSPAERHVPQLHSGNYTEVTYSGATNCRHQNGLLPDPIGERMVEEELVSEPCSTEAYAEVPMDVENEAQTLVMIPARPLDEEFEVEPTSSQNVPPVDDEQEATQVENSIAIASSRELFSEPMSKEDATVAKNNNIEELWEQVQVMERGEEEEAERLAEEAGSLVLYASQNVVDRNNSDTSALLEERETTLGSVDIGDGWMILADSTKPTASEPQCVKDLQVGQPQPLSSNADDIHALSDRALLLQLLEENLKLKAVLGKVFKQQNDVIHSLASRIEQLEAQQPKLLHSDLNRSKSRKRINHGGDRERSLRSRRGKLDSTLQLDSDDWLSAESDEYF